MSKTVVTKVLCDQCNAPASNEDLSLAYEGKAFQVDLCDRCRTALEKAINPLIQSGRKAKVSVPTISRRPSGAAARGVDVRDVREWARKNNIKLPERGRIPGSILDKFQAAS